MGNDPPGSFTRVLHPRHGRHGEPPADVIPVGRSVIVPANGTLPNIVLSPRAIPRIKQVLERERFDVVHLHEPMTPIICAAALAWARARSSPPSTRAATSAGCAPASGWGFLMDRIDRRIAVSDAARESAANWLPGDYEVVPNGVLIPPDADPAAASTVSSSSAGTSRARECTCCCERGPRSTAAPARGCASSVPTRWRCGC